MEKSYFTTNSSCVTIKNRRVDIRSGKTDTLSSPIEIRYIKQAKNSILTLSYKCNKSDKVPKEIHFFIRYADDANYTRFSMRNGNEIKFVQISSGKIVLQTDYTKISSDNLFTEKFNLILSAFEESFSVLFDGLMIMNIEHLNEQSGDFFIRIEAGDSNELAFSFDKFIISEEILSFEPIIKMNKNATAYFMQGNDFYEQNAYELALYYYKKGILYGAGDDKIYNRIGNLQFLIENYPSAEFYYKLAKEQSPENDEYIFNYTRSLIKQNKEKDFIPYIEKCIAEKKYNFELSIDYAGFLIQKKDWSKAKEILELIKYENEYDTAFNTKYGRVLIELGDIDTGKELLYDAALKLKDNDPSSSIILLKYSLERKPDAKSLKLITIILYEADEFNEINGLLSALKDEVTFDGELFQIYLESMLFNGLYGTVWQEISKLEQSKITNDLLLLQAESGIHLKKLVDVERIINILYNDESFMETHINRLAIVLFKLAGFTKKVPLYMHEIYTNANTHSKDFIDVQKEYAKLLVDLTEFEKALPILQDLLKKLPEDIEIQYNTGIALDGVEDWEGARIYLQKVYSATGNPEVGFIFAHTIYYLKMFNDALQIMIKHYDALPDDGKKDNLIGNIYLSLGNNAEAQRYYYSALEKDNENEEYAINLAESFYKLKDYASAFMITKQIVKPDNFDRAMILHIKLKEHLYFSVNCSICNVQWEITKQSFNENTIFEIDNTLPMSKLPAGTCPVCSKIYCRSCAQINEVEEYLCPVDGEILKENIINKNPTKKGRS